MKVRIRFERAPAQRRPGRNRHVALALAALLNPAALMAWVLAFWRLGADLHWTSAFAIPEGVFSHWQVWLGVGLVLFSAGSGLNRYARNVERGARFEAAQMLSRQS